MELCVKINSQYPGMNQILSNGVERVWIDGRPASRKYDCMLTMTSIDGVSHAELQFYYGGTGNTPTPLSVYQSQFAIARTYIGPALF